MEAIADRTLPHNLEAERSVLGAMLLDATAWPKVAAIVRAEDYYRDAHRRIHESMTRLVEAGSGIDFVLLREDLQRAGDLDECGGPAYLAALVDGLPRNVHVEHYAEIVREKARLRGLVFAANKLLAGAYEASVPASLLVEGGVQALLAYAETRQHVVTQAGKDALDYVMALDPGEAPEAMSTGYTDLDDVLSGGIRKDELLILAGRPSHGKTSLGLGIAKGLAQRGHSTVFFSLEMRSRLLAERLVSWGARVDQSRLRRRFLGDRDYGRISQAVGALADLPLYLQDSVATLTEVSAWCERLATEKGVTCVVIDYLQLLLPERRSSSRENDVAAISRGLKRLARDRAVIAISQLNRSPEGRRDNRPRLSDLRESGALEQDCDIALLLFQPSQYDDAQELDGIAEVIVAKNRQGPTGTVKLAYLKSLAALFENLAVGATA